MSELNQTRRLTVILQALGFKPMTSDDYLGWAGAGPESFIRYVTAQGVECAVIYEPKGNDGASNPSLSFNFINESCDADFINFETSDEGRVWVNEEPARTPSEEAADG